MRLPSPGLRLGALDTLNSKNRELLSLLPDRRTPEGGIGGDALPGPVPATWHGLAADPSRAAMYAFALFLLAPLPWVLVYFLPPLNHDAAALLHFSQRWLAGERLYVDLIDVNPPLVFILNLVPATIARLTPISAPSALMLCVLGWIAFGFVLSWRLLRGAPGTVSAHSPLPLSAALPVPDDRLPGIRSSGSAST